MAEQQKPARSQMDKTEENEQIEGFNPLSPGSEAGEAGIAVNVDTTNTMGLPGSAAQPGNVGERGIETDMDDERDGVGTRANTTSDLKRPGA